MITSVALYVFKALYNRLLILGCVRWQLGEPACSPRLLGSASPEEQVPKAVPSPGSPQPLLHLVQLRPNHRSICHPLHFPAFLVAESIILMPCCAMACK